MAIGDNNNSPSNFFPGREIILTGVTRKSQQPVDDIASLGHAPEEEYPCDDIAGYASSEEDEYLDDIAPYCPAFR